MEQISSNSSKIMWSALLSLVKIDLYIVIANIYKFYKSVPGALVWRHLTRCAQG